MVLKTISLGLLGTGISDAIFQCGCSISYKCNKASIKHPYILPLTFFTVTVHDLECVVKYIALLYFCQPHLLPATQVDSYSKQYQRETQLEHV